jgi:immune inhibitor A
LLIISDKDGIMKNWKLIALTILIGVSGSLQAMPLSPESVASLRASGGLAEVAQREQEARSQGWDAPGENILPALRALKRDDADEVVINVPIILVEFADNEANQNVYPRERFESMLFSENEYRTGSMRDYFYENSYGEVVMAGVVAGWIRAPQTYAYYVNGNGGRGGYPRNVQRLVIDAATAVDNQVNFRQFDNDGNGTVDNLVIVHAGDGAESHNGDPNMIWSHSSALRNRAIRLDGVTINPYVVVMETGNIGVFGHELGHGIFQLPDLYDRDYSSEGVGLWSMMAAGSWGGGGARPTHFDAWSKLQMGFVREVTLGFDDDRIIFPPVENDAVVYRIWTRGEGGSQYFLAENRQPIRFDDAIPGPGLCIYHVDEEVVWDQNDNEWYPGHENNGHYLVAIEQADGRWDIEQPINAGDSGDPYPGRTGNRTFDAGSTPNSRDYNGADTRVAFTNITEEGRIVFADIAIGRRDGVERGTLLHDNGHGSGHTELDGYWSRQSFTTTGQFTLASILLQPFNPAPNQNAPCIVRVYSEAANRNLSQIVFERRLDQVPAFNPDDPDAAWLTIDLPQNNRPVFQSNTHFSVIYGPAPGGDLNPDSLREGDGWWNAFDDSANGNESYIFRGNNPAAAHRDWQALPGDLLIRAVSEGFGDPDITLEQASVNFGITEVNSSSVRSFTIANIGRARLAVGSVAIADGEDADQFQLIGGEGAFNIEAESQRSIRVEFAPTNRGAKTATVVITSDDPDEAERTISLSGTGSGLPVIYLPTNQDNFPITHRVGRNLTVDFQARDPEGGRLTWSITNQGRLPQEGPRFTDNGDGTARFSWAVDTVNAGRYAPEMTVTDPNGDADRIRLLMRINLQNSPPEWLEPPEVRLTEDAARTVVARLDSLYYDPDRDSMTFELVDPPAVLNLQLDPSGAVTAQPNPNFFSVGGIEVRVVGEDSEGASTPGSFRVSVAPVNDAPLPFELSEPADNGIMADLYEVFKWRVAVDVEQDRLSYNLYYHHVMEENPYRITGLRDTTCRLSPEIRDALLRNTEGQMVSGSWWVEADDGLLITESTTRRTLSIFLNVEDSELLPAELALAEPFPNPFNGQVSLRFDLPRAAIARVQVVDLTGRVVSVLSDQMRAAGRHSVSWNAGGLPSGLYIVRMEAEGRAFNRKMMLMK